MPGVMLPPEVRFKNPLEAVELMLVFDLDVVIEGSLGVLSLREKSPMVAGGFGAKNVKN